MLRKGRQFIFQERWQKKECIEYKISFLNIKVSNTFSLCPAKLIIVWLIWAYLMLRKCFLRKHVRLKEGLMLIQDIICNLKRMLLVKSVVIFIDIIGEINL